MFSIGSINVLSNAHLLIDNLRVSSLFSATKKIVFADLGSLSLYSILFSLGASIFSGEFIVIIESLFCFNPKPITVTGVEWKFSN